MPVALFASLTFLETIALLLRWRKLDAPPRAPIVAALWLAALLCVTAVFALSPTIFWLQVLMFGFVALCSEAALATFKYAVARGRNRAGRDASKT